MVSLNQVLLLEQKVESAVQRIVQLKAENDALRKKCVELTNSLAAKTEQLSSFAMDQSKIESGILKALERLNSVENSVLRSVALAQKGASEPNGVNSISFGTKNDSVVSVDQSGKEAINAVESSVNLTSESFDGNLNADVNNENLATDNVSENLTNRSFSSDVLPENASSEVFAESFSENSSIMTENSSVDNSDSVDGDSVEENSDSFDNQNSLFSDLTDNSSPSQKDEENSSSNAQFDIF